MSDRLITINDALLATGNEPLTTEYDGSTEWMVADSAYRRAISSLIERHTWNFATTTATLAAIAPVNPSKLYATAYVLPAGCLAVKGPFINGMPMTAYEIVDQKLCCDYSSGVSLKYVRMPTEDVLPGLFTECLALKVEAGILRGLNEDYPAADKRDGVAEAMLAEARNQSDQQEGKRAVFRSRVAARRGGFRRFAPNDGSWPKGGRP